jgi:hypothetical protein
MPDLGVWTPQEIADEIGMSREFVVTAIKGRTARYSLSATKKGRTWLISDADAKEFIDKFRNPVRQWYTPNDIAKAIGMTRTYVMNCITGYGGRKEPRLAGVKRGDRWCIGKEEAERFIGEHGRV